MNSWQKQLDCYFPFAVSGIVIEYISDPRLTRLYILMDPHNCRMTLSPKNHSLMSHLTIIHCHPNICFQRCTSGMDMEKYLSDELNAYCYDNVDVFNWQINVSYYPSPAYIWRFTTTEFIDLLASGKLQTRFSDYPDAQNVIEEFERMFLQITNKL